MTSQFQICTNLATLLILSVITSTTTATITTIPDDYTNNEIVNDYTNNTIKNDIHWIGGTFKFPCASTKILYKNSGKYISKNILATRGQISSLIDHENGGETKLYLTLPRYKHGIPATLVQTTINKYNKLHPNLNQICSIIYQPYPTWLQQEEGNCKALQSAVDLVIDHKKHILWVLDTGVLYSTNVHNSIQKCTPKIIGINLHTNEIIKTIQLDGLVTKTTRLQYLILDYDHMGNLYFYVSDAANRAIIVYNVNANHGYRVVLPKAVTNGCQTRDVLYLALIYQKNGTTCLYFTYLGAKKIYAIDTNYLKSATTEGHVQEIGTKNDRYVILGTDKRHSILLRAEGNNVIYSWDTSKPFNLMNFHVVYRGPSCQLATHAIFDPNLNKIRVLESNFPDYFQDKVGCGVNQQLSILPY